MAAETAQQRRLFVGFDPVGDDTLVPILLAAREGISQPFRFKVTAVCQSGRFDANRLLNQPACVTLQASGAPVRYFHGIVQSASADGSVRGVAGAADQETYNITMVPRLWFLGQTTDCRVWQKKSAGDILQAMFQDAGLSDISGLRSTTQREYHSVRREHAPDRDRHVELHHQQQRHSASGDGDQVQH